MIDKSYFNNVASKNVLHDYTPKNMTNDNLNNFVDTSLENMLMNSNLENENIIK